MKANRRKLIGGTLAMSAVLAASGGMAHAQEKGFPDRMVRIVVPYPPGGFNDTLGRLVAARLAEMWKQSVVVENKPGAGTMIGTTQVARAPADGYTLLVNQFPFAANPFLYKKMNYDTRADFAPVVLAGRSPMLLVVNESAPYRSVADLLQAARKAPGTVTYGSSGSGSSNHLAMALFESMADISLMQVPYKGSTPMLTDLAGGQIPVAFDAFPHVLPFIQTGKIRPIAIADDKRSTLMPDLPTISESGVQGYEVSSWHGFMAPAGTPQDIVQKLNRDINAVLEEEAVKKTFREQGVVPDGGSSEAFGRFIDQQMALWERVVKDAGIHAE
ncbi:tripartite tricarboxylate transporter substrate binding protein [Paracandidimonas soli]|uniref:tripartite tricarboxylate transporter substrate binding protein n=1 Tax=Paracandidimonas soli TaxID=1917182 RepID=UPI00333FCB0A